MFRLDNTRHHVRETEAVRFLRRELNEPELLTYWDATAGTWSLGYWFNRTQGLVDYLDDLGKSYEAGPVLTRESVRKYRAWHRPPDWAAHKKRIASAERERLREFMEQHEEHTDSMEYLRRKTGRIPTFY